MRKQGYEVLTAADGFAALCALRGAYPDVLIAELNLAHMSGFELLSVVRTRFPHIAVIAISGEYTAVTVPNEAICDAFLEKGPNFHFDLIEEALRLIKESPLRSSLDFVRLLRYRTCADWGDAEGGTVRMGRWHHSKHKFQ